MTERSDWFRSAEITQMSTPEQPHDTEDLVRLVTLTRQEQGWTQARLAEAAGIPASDVSRFEAQEVIPARPLAMRFLEVMGRIEPGLFR